MGLYDNETVEQPFFDMETGREFQDYHVKKEEEEIKQIVEEGKTLEAMKKGDGWKFVATFITDAVDAYKEKMTYEVDFEKIKRMQEAVKAYRNVEAYIDYKINEAKGLETKKTPNRG